MAPVKCKECRSEVAVPLQHILGVRVRYLGRSSPELLVCRHHRAGGDICPQCDAANYDPYPDSSDVSTSQPRCRECDAIFWIHHDSESQL